MGQALYRKYRSKKLSDIVGQSHITASLQNAILNGKISHAYLFSGPRGVGKTSIARILAHEINNLEYSDDTYHIDIIEIDAASNRRIDEIRDLREKVHNAPSFGKYKVYIIDEVHMLTGPAFNALLKTLEEPPQHVIFILATTEAHKIPETIVSRTQRYSFKPISKDDIFAHLKYIAKTESISIDDDAIKLIADHSDGSFRDSISLLDQIQHSGKKITKTMVEDHLGVAPESLIESIYSQVTGRDLGGITDSLNIIMSQGLNPVLLSKQLFDYILNKINASSESRPKTLKLMRELIQTSSQNDPFKYLQVILLDASLDNDIEHPRVINQPEPERPLPSPKISNATNNTKQTSNISSVEKPEKDKSPKKNDQLKSTDINQDTWVEILQSIKNTHNTLYSVARMAVPEFLDSEIILTFNFTFHQKRLNDDRNKKIISDIVKNATGKHMKISCVVDKTVTRKDVNPEPVMSAVESIQNISNIFGGGEVLE